VLAVAIVFALAANGKMPINDRQMQTYLMLHPELAPAMMGRAQALDDQKQAAAQSAAMRKVGQKSFFRPCGGLRHRPRRRQGHAGGIL